MESGIVSSPQQASNYDELVMQSSLLFSDSFEELKNLRKQLYSAAEYFELSYCKDNQEQLVVETLKDYISKAIISTVDHLGSVAYKVNNFLDQKVDQVSGAEIRVSCIEQRLRTYQDFIGCSGLSQQSLLIKTPMYHKQYVIPVAERKHAIGKIESTRNIGSPFTTRDSLLQSGYEAVQAPTMEPHSSIIRGTCTKRHSKSPSVVASSSPATFSFTRTLSNKAQEKRAVSPLRFALKRSGSLISSSIIPKDAKQWYPSEERRSSLSSIHATRDRTEETQQCSKKNKPLFKALLSMRKLKQDGRILRNTPG